MNLKSKGMVNRIISAVLLAVIFILVIFSLRDFSVRLNKAVEDQTEVYLSETAVQSATLFDLEMQSIVETLELLAAYVSTFNSIISPEIMYMMESALNGASFSRTGVATANGALYIIGAPDEVTNSYADEDAESVGAVNENLKVYDDRSEMVVDVSEEGYFKKAMRGEVAISETVTSYATGEDAIVIMVPVFKDDKVAGALGASYDLSKLEEVIDITTFGGEGYTYVVNSKGDIILSTSHPSALMYSGNAFDTLQEWTEAADNGSIEGARRDLLSGKKGSAYYSGEGHESYLSYAPTSYNNWSVISVIPASVVSRQAGDIGNLAMELSVKIIILSAAILVFILVVQTRSNRALKQSHAETLLNEQRYKTVFDNSNDIVFEWSNKGNSVFFSNKWYEMFDPPPTSFTEIDKNTDELQRIHEEDRRAFLMYIGSQRSSIPMDELEFRLKNKSGRYVWLRIRSTTIYDEHHELESVVGTITDITREYEERRQLIRKSQSDALTGFFNKVASEKLVNGYLELAAVDSFAAYLIIDFDNFKDINDKGGHPYGDKILTTIAKGMKALFRKSDILMRIGGDEFAVFIKNISSAATAIDKAEEIVELFHRTDHVESGPAKISCSIGISYYPKDGASYTELYRKADVALYEAKAQGKDRYVVYDQGMEEDSKERRALLKTLNKEDDPK